MTNLILGLITGIFFGFFLQKGQALKYDKQLGMLRFKDFTILKVMVSAILVGMVGIYFLVDMGIGKLSLKPTIFGANIIGGLIFGLGWGMLGYCPGTALGAAGEGRFDAFWGGALGMLVGAGVFAEVYSYIKDDFLKWGNLGKLTIPQVVEINHWVVIPIVWGFLVLLLVALEKKKL
ncbi:MAG TPA: YeeE/YedE thiosulfate transporter family protein [Thermodesulfobacteriota bacterium]|nr:YeeE/YedE thiosulfate transporter family protein [Thermodesulfobacteriota bacterium]